MEKSDLGAPMWRLEEEAKLLRGNLDTIFYKPEREQQIKHRLGMIALEMMCQHMEAAGETPAEEFAHSQVNYFGFVAHDDRQWDQRINLQVKVGPNPHAGTYQV